ncbi:hypothetical protein ACLOJK_021081 [Asimina triloba]
MPRFVLYALAYKHRRESYMGLEMHQTISAVVEMTKDNYLASVPGFIVTATVKALPSPSTSRRLLLLLDSLGKGSDTSSSKRAKKRSSYDIGSIVEAEITDVKHLELRLKFGIDFHGRVHITEVTDNRQSLMDPLSNFRIGQLLTARLIAKIHPSGNRKKGCEWELSVKPSVLSGAEEVGGLLAENLNFSVGEVVTGYVIKADNEWVHLTVCRDVKAQLFILDSSSDPSELQEFKNHFTVGQVVSGSILSINKEKRLMRLTLCSSSGTPRASVDSSIVKSNDPDYDDNKYILEGDILNGRISKVLPGTGGLQVQIGPHLYGKVHFTELRDMWVSNPLDGYCEGQFVKCKVLEISQSFKGTVHVELSLRPSLLGIQAENSTGDLSHKRFDKIEDLHPDMDIQGYVKNVTPKGCFVLLSRKIDAKILLSNLSNGYLEKPEKEFPIGRLVTAKVLSVEPLSKRVELTLKTVSGISASKSVISDLHKLPVGDVISGNIRRIEPYGLFINIDSTNMVGLCHISELSDSSIENIESKYKVGDKVLAKILKVDSVRCRVSLGMKNSYIGDNAGADVTPNQTANEAIDADGSNIGSQHYMVNLVGDFAGTLDPYGELAIEHHPVLEQAESRALIPPLEVPLDDLGGSDLEDGFTGAKEETHQAKTISGKSKKHINKKAKEARELEIRAAEERLLENDVPRTADEFEKWVRSSPNSSVAWINYMAFMLSQADVEKARSIAERCDKDAALAMVIVRMSTFLAIKKWLVAFSYNTNVQPSYGALQTINIREEEEKMHIWVAYFNLENEYGKPREEAVMKIFQRALQYCDAKKIHLALLGMYERTNQHNLADELFNRMTKKFKTSCKVWLRRIENILKQGKDGIQSAVNRALLVLPRNKHIKFISKAAILEFKCGVPDHGRSMFEGILREYPKRTDLWSVYLDQEIRLGDVDMIHALFERAICLSLPPKKMKFLFKKYLEYAKSYGDEDRSEYVKKKAMDYVESSLT